MRHNIALILSLFLLITLGVLVQFFPSVQAESSKNDYVIFRANSGAMYMMNATAPVAVLAIPFHDNRPIYATVNIHVSIKGLNVNYTFNSTYQVRSGIPKTIYLPAMNEGHYRIIMYAEYKGIVSNVVDQDFAVVPAPLPYEITFTNDGSQIIFKSNVLNATGKIDPKKPFHIEIYLWDGNQQSLVATYSNVTNLTINVPDSWKTGILIVDVVDIYGWVNGMSIDLAHMQFQGYPLEYDYYQTRRFPLAGYSITWYIVILLIAAIMLYIGKRVIEYERRD